MHLDTDKTKSLHKMSRILIILLLFITACTEDKPQLIKGGVPNQLDSLERVIDSVKLTINVQLDMIEELNSELDKQSNDTEALSKELNSVQVEFRNQIKDLNKRVDGLKSSVDSLGKLPKPDRPGKITVKLPDMDQTGTKDVSDQMQEFFFSIPDSSIVIFPDSATYRVESGIVLYDKKDVVIQGNGSTIIANDTMINRTVVKTDAPYFLAIQNFGDRDTNKIWYSTPHKFPRVRQHFKIYSAHDIIIRNLNIRGANPGAGTSLSGGSALYEAQHGYEISRNSSNVLIQDCEVSYVWGDLVYFAGDVSNSTVRNCNLHHSGRQGVAVVDGIDNKVINSKISHIRRSAIDIEPNTASDVIDGFTVDSCTFWEKRLTWIANGGNRQAIVKNIHISNNDVNTEGNIIVLAGGGTKRGPYFIHNNDIQRTSGRMGRMENVNYVELVGNKVGMQWSKPNEFFRFTQVDSFLKSDNFLYTNYKGNQILGPHCKNDAGPYYNRGCGKINPNNPLEWMSADNIIDGNGNYLTDSIYTTRVALESPWEKCK